MYKITSLVTGSISIEGKSLSYGASILVKDLSQDIVKLQESKLVKVKQIVEKVVKVEVTPTNKKDKNKDKNSSQEVI